MKIKIVGNGKPVIGIVACLHGNELLGKKIIDRLNKIIPLTGQLIFILANEEAMNIGKRFVSQDLNRSFPGNKNGNHEERLAVKLLSELSVCDFIIDLHSTIAKTDSFVIFTKRGKKIKEFVNSIPIAKVVFLESKINKNNSLINNASCGVSVEFNRNTNFIKAAGMIGSVLINLGVLEGKKEKVAKEFYSAYGVIEKKGTDRLRLKNFKKTILNKEIFYPVLFGEKEYKDIVCIKTKQL